MTWKKEITCRTGEIVKSYSEYLKTKHWKDTKIWAKKSLSGKCHICGSLRQLHVHHKSYKNLGNESVTDMEILCRGCHRGEHNLANGKEYSQLEKNYIAGERDEPELARDEYSRVVCKTGEIATSIYQYEATDHWKKLRFDLICRVGGHCAICASSSSLEIHHIHYKTLGNEDLCDVVPLCSRCHESEHSSKDKVFTEDSFYDNGLYLDDKFFMEHALTIVKAMRGDTESILAEVFKSKAMALKVIRSGWFINHPLNK